jgi:uncharacterized linocin/CFP29 family protein
MDMLKRNLAPITDAAWAELDKEAGRFLPTRLSVRRFADVTGPHGLEHGGVSLGRLTFPPEPSTDGVMYGIHKVLPLIETKIFFHIKPQEFDNLNRGAKDIDFSGLYEAADKLAAFEEKAAYFGFDRACIVGIYAKLQTPPVSFGLSVESCIDAVGEAQVRLFKAGVGGPAALVVSEQLCKFLARPAAGGTLRKIIEEQIGGPIICARECKGALLVSLRGGDMELTLGQDIAIGYEAQDEQGLKFFLIESFTFRVINPEVIVALDIRPDGK